MKLLLAAVLLFGSTDDGWVTWRVEAGDNVGNWCCSTWSAGKAVATTCHLDGGSLTLNHADPTFRPTGEIQIYAKLADGRATRIRALSPQCPVELPGDITDLGLVETRASLDWLNDQVGANPDLSSDALLAISAHAGPDAVALLVAAIENRQLRKKVREEALLWLVHSGSEEAYAYLDRLLSRR